jgi:hydroxymethylglutaryl-CoA synthase
MQQIGISGFATYLPPYRVCLEDWCGWTGESWDKIQAVVGNSFRMRGPHQNVYTMAANAVLRLIKQYDVDPATIGYLALGTESSTDNSAGAVIVKGMVDKALREEGCPEINRHCEVPEFKHACLGGVYAMKGAARYLAFDGQGRTAIVVSADIAEYARGTTGEPTQGAGAVAVLMESDPKLLSIDLHQAGSAADYRGPDFRKPFIRFSQQEPPRTGQLRDFPVFNGKYSTTCYVDEVLAALDDMFGKRNVARSSYFRDLTAVFLHRPYTRMPETGWALGYLFALASGSQTDREELESYADAANVTLDALLSEMASNPRVYELVERRNIDDEVYPLGMTVLRSFRKYPAYQEVVGKKMQYGSELMKQVGNLYTAALPAWMAAGLEDAAASGVDIDGHEILTVGYGSGDAAEVIPMQLVTGWRDNAKLISFERCFDGAFDLDQRQYECLHDGGHPDRLPVEPRGEFVIDRIGKLACDDFDENGIEYYRYVGGE